jgi:hypothetical protein
MEFRFEMKNVEIVWAIRHSSISATYFGTLSTSLNRKLHNFSIFQMQRRHLSSAQVWLLVARKKMKNSASKGADSLNNMSNRKKTMLMNR